MRSRLLKYKRKERKKMCRWQRTDRSKRRTIGEESRIQNPNGINIITDYFRKIRESFWGINWYTWISEPKNFGLLTNITFPKISDSCIFGKYRFLCESERWGFFFVKSPFIFISGLISEKSDFKQSRLEQFWSGSD